MKVYHALPGTGEVQQLPCIVFDRARRRTVTRFKGEAIPLDSYLNNHCEIAKEFQRIGLLANYYSTHVFGSN